jgi:hypothetical protein
MVLTPKRATMVCFATETKFVTARGLVSLQEIRVRPGIAMRIKIAARNRDFSPSQLANITPAP